MKHGGMVTFCLGRELVSLERRPPLTCQRAHDTHGTAESIQIALQMPLAERQKRHQKLLERIRQQDVHWWRRTFLETLSAVAPD